jgi:hypothetical protein
MARKRRRRHPVSPQRLWMLKVFGFRYSQSRDAYVLRIVGRRLGPVLQVRPDTQGRKQAAADR